MKTKRKPRGKAKPRTWTGWVRECGGIKRVGFTRADAELANICRRCRLYEVRITATEEARRGE